MSLEVVRPKARIRPEEITVSIYRGDSLSISRGTRNRYFTDVAFVSLLYDRDTGKVAVKPLKEDSPEAFKLRMDRSKRGVVSLRSLAIQFKIQLPEHTRFPAKWDDENAWLEFNLNEGTSSAR
jgi:hypothetical protein